MRATKLTARGLAYVLRPIGRKIAKAYRARQTPHGKQSVKKLMAHGAATNSVEIEAPKLFDRAARKWGIDYAFYKTGPDKYDDDKGQRQYEWGHYGSDRAALEQDFAARVQEYQRLYNVGVRQTEAPGLYKYYSTQRPVDIGTFPKPPRNAPDEIVNYDQRVPVENGSFLAWGHLTYTRPLTKRQASDYELRPAPDNPDRPRSIREQMKTAAKQAEADRGQAAPKKNAPDRGDR